jgi:hypothetical protein
MSSGDHHRDHNHGAHAGHDKHAGHRVAMFRDRFWVSLVLTVPRSSGVTCCPTRSAGLFAGLGFVLSPAVGAVLMSASSCCDSNCHPERSEGA